MWKSNKTQFQYKINTIVALLNTSILLTALLSLTCIEGFLFRPLKNDTESEDGICNNNKELNTRYTHRNAVIGEKDMESVAEQHNQLTSHQGKVFINFTTHPVKVQSCIETYIANT